MKYLNKLLVILAICIMLSVTISGCKTTNKVKLNDFSINMDSPQIPIKEIELQMDTAMGFGKLKKQNVTVLYFPQEDAVCLRYKYESYTYHQFWNKRGRLGFVSALQNYNIDYEARDLQRNSANSLQNYGIVRGYLVWQQLSIFVQAHANMNLELGYTFNDRSPYFTVYQRNAEYIDVRGMDSPRTSPNITMYFTRAQAAELAEIFEQYIITGDEDETGLPAAKDDVPKDDY
jgi:hypothetical protein